MAYHTNVFPEIDARYPDLLTRCFRMFLEICADMSTGDLARIADYIVSRRELLGYRTTVDLHKELPDVSLRTLYSIEGAERGARPSNYAAIERVLKWGPGSIRRIGQGEGPIDLLNPEPPRGEPEPPRAERIVVEIDRLVQELRQEMGQEPRPSPDGYPPGYPEHRPPSVRDEPEDRLSRRKDSGVGRRVGGQDR